MSESICGFGGSSVGRFRMRALERLKDDPWVLKRCAEVDDGRGDFKGCRSMLVLRNPAVKRTVVETEVRGNAREATARETAAKRLPRALREANLAGE